MQRATYAKSNERIWQWVTNEFLQATSATSNEQILQRVITDFLQRATSATNSEQILQEAARDFITSRESNDWISTSNEQQVKIYASVKPVVKMVVKTEFSLWSD